MPDKTVCERESSLSSWLQGFRCIVLGDVTYGVQMKQSIQAARSHRKQSQEREAGPGATLRAPPGTYLFREAPRQHRHLGQGHNTLQGCRARIQLGPRLQYLQQSFHFPHTGWRRCLGASSQMHPRARIPPRNSAYTKGTSMALFSIPCCLLPGQSSPLSQGLSFCLALHSPYYLLLMPGSDPSL